MEVPWGDKSMSMNQGGWIKRTWCYGEVSERKRERATMQLNQSTMKLGEVEDVQRTSCKHESEREASVRIRTSCLRHAMREVERETFLRFLLFTLGLRS